MLKQIEGSHAMAEAIALCRPEVICAYPITPQTHIVEGLGDLVRDGSLVDCEFINVESEFAALSVAIGASAAGARAYTATASQGLLFMAEAVYNASGEPQLLRSGWLFPVFFAVWAFGLWLIERLLGSLALGIYTDDLDTAEQIKADPKGLFAVDDTCYDVYGASTGYLPLICPVPPTPTRKPASRSAFAHVPTTSRWGPTFTEFHG